MGSPKMKSLRDEIQTERDKLASEFEALRNKIAALDGVLRKFDGQPISEPTAASGARPKRGEVKGAVLDVISDAGEAGLTTAECIERVHQRIGSAPDKGTVSSLLSRYKASGALIFNGTRYCLSKYAGPRNTEAAA